MRIQLGHIVVVDNKPEATGRFGAQHAVRSEPDGRTLLIGHGANVLICPLMQGTKKVFPTFILIGPHPACADSPSRDSGVAATES